MKKKSIAVLGSTGSIGTQALEVINNHKELFHLEIISAHSNTSLLIEQALRYVPGHVVISDDRRYNEVAEALSSLPTEVHCGEQALTDIVTLNSVDMVLTALVGFAGLQPTISALKSGKKIALANKETLVVAGELIMQLAGDNNTDIYPVDSEHSAIFQCLTGEEHNAIEKIYLTASGGPFLNKTKEELKNVTKEEALNHPNWCMGNKVTIDSATLMNKGLEAIEAKWLFNLEPEQIEVVIHPQSIIHSMVQFEDGSIKAQMGLPDMRLPIQYALGYPDRLTSDFQRFDFTDYPALTFTKPDTNVFRNLDLAFKALKKGGNLPCIMNAANEQMVDAFLNEKITFLQIPVFIEEVMDKVSFISNPALEDYIITDKEARKVANDLIN